MTAHEPAGGRPSRAPHEVSSESRLRRWKSGESRRLLQPRLVLLTFAGCLLFGYPFLAVFSRNLRIGGIPLLYVYLFGAWAVFIALIARLVDAGGRQRSRDRSSGDDP